MPRREYHSSCACVPPGGPPEGILDVDKFCILVVLFKVCFFLLVRSFLALARVQTPLSNDDDFQVVDELKKRR